MSYSASASSGRTPVTIAKNSRGRANSRSASAQHSPAPAAPNKTSSKKGWRSDAQKAPDPILFQTYFKSVGPRTYAAQLKRAGNGNHYLVFTEGKRDAVTDEVRKTSLYVFSEDFVSFFKLLKETAEHVRSHPVPAEVAEKRVRYWEKQKAEPNESTGARAARK